jgi:hypothetical protein
MEASGVRRSGDGGQQGRAQPVGLHRQPRAVDVLGEVDALDGKRRLVAERFQQAPLVGAERRARPLGLQADDGHHAAPGVHGQEEPAGPRVSLAIAARGAIVRPAPAGGGEIGLAQAISPRMSR